MRDEFFHSASHELLVDQGSNSVLSTSFRTVDDYVWLGGRPVVLLRGKLDPSLDVRRPDSSVDCRRNGEAAACGAWFPVTDHIGKPVLMLDSAGRVAGAADYDPFGHINRVIHHAGTKHPYASSPPSVLATFSQPPENKVQVRMRALFHLVDTVQGADVAELVDVTTGSTLASTSGAKQGRVVTSWVEPTAGSFLLRFTLNPSPPVIHSHTGVVVEGYEYQRFQEGAQPFWTPLRFPGQYYDAETDFFENWNRYYDPSIGRYLQPEPVLARTPILLPAYTYALNNPQFWTDATGLEPVLTPYKTRDEAAVAGFKWIQKTHSDWISREYNFYIWKSTKDGTWRYSTPRTSLDNASGHAKALVPNYAGGWCHTHRPDDGRGFARNDKEQARTAQEKIPGIVFYLMDKYQQLRVFDPKSNEERQLDWLPVLP